MNLEGRKGELYDKHLHIFSECNKLKTHLNLAFDKSELIIKNILHVDDTALLKKYTKIYKYLNNLHLELVDVNCQFDLFFKNSETEFSDLISHNSEEIKNESILRSDSLDKLEKLSIENSSSCSMYSTDVLSSDSLLTNEKLSERHGKNKKLKSTTFNEKVQNESDKTSFKEIFSTKLTESKNNEASNYFVLTSHESEKNVSSLQNNKKTESLKNKEKVIESSSESSLQNNSKKSKKKRKSKAKKLNNIEPLKLEQNYKLEYNFYEDKKSYTIPSVPEPKENDLCCLGYVETPSNFYIQVVCKEATYIDEFHDKIEEYVDSVPYYYIKSDAVQIFKPYCACFIENLNTWYRAKIIDWLLEDDDEVIVQLIDSGYTCKSLLTNLRELADHLCKIPTITFKCELNGIVPPNDNYDGKWPEESLKFFFDVVKPKIDLEFVINYVDKIGDTLSIDLAIKDIESISALMVLNNKAKAIYPDCEPAPQSDQKVKLIEPQKNHTKDIVPVLKNIKQNLIESSDSEETEGACAIFTGPTKKEIEDAKKRLQILNTDMINQVRFSQGHDENKQYTEIDVDDVDEKLFDNVNLAVYNYDPIDERRVCKFLNIRTGCWKGKDCKYSHEPLDPDGWTTDRVPGIYTAKNYVDLPTAGMTARVKVKSIKDLRTFYVHIKSFPDKSNSIYAPANSLKALIELMNKESEVKTYRTPVPPIPAYSEIILVKHNDLWLRASCKDIENDKRVQVFLVDYGDEITVNIEDLRQIKEKFLNFPFQAVHCELHNTAVKNIPEELIENGLNFLEMCILNKTLNAQVMQSFDGELRVLLYDEENQDIGEQLIQAQLVNRNVDNYFFPETHQHSIKMVD